MKGKLFLISGASGAGKSTIVKPALNMPGIEKAVSHTTRNPREGEVDGRDYHFVGHDRFQSMITNGYFLEHAQVYGKCYGTGKKQVEEIIGRGNSVVLVMDVQGVETILQKKPESVSIFVAAPNYGELEKRLRGRGSDDEEVIARRLRTAKAEMQKIGLFKYVLVNEFVETSQRQIQELIESEIRGEDYAPLLNAVRLQ